MSVARHKSQNDPENGAKDVVKDVVEIVVKPVDPRVARTREQIDAAFVAMLHRRTYVGIRVGEIARKAGVGRATFYAHYATKHELLQSQLRRIVCPMIVATHDRACPIDATALFAHLTASPRIYHGLMSGDSGPLAQRMLLTCFEERLRELASMQDDRGAGGEIVPDGLADRFIASSLLTLVSWCIEVRSTRTPLELQRVYAVLIGGLKD